MKITEAKLRMIVRKMITEAPRGRDGRPTARGNRLPEKDSNWYRLAKALDIGMLELNVIADDMDYYDFRDLDISISPGSLAKGSRRKKFLNALRHVLEVDDMTDEELMGVIEES